MTKSKTTKQNKETKPSKKAKRNKIQFVRLFYILMFSGAVANTIFLAMLISNPETGMYILAGFSGISAIYFLYNAIK
ncbi:hypothetical protein DRH27_06095 [Candidatus Falkowbacteria bacterium]|nr:MAG: hypothetical protein DRH27_06095 [Candidatus Falkowbacteria bacterium]